MKLMKLPPVKVQEQLESLPAIFVCSLLGRNCRSWNCHAENYYYHHDWKDFHLAFDFKRWLSCCCSYHCQPQDLNCSCCPCPYSYSSTLAIVIATRLIIIIALIRELVGPAAAVVGTIATTTIANSFFQNCCCFVVGQRYQIDHITRSTTAIAAIVIVITIGINQVYCYFAKYLILTQFYFSYSVQNYDHFFYSYFFCSPCYLVLVCFQYCYHYYKEHYCNKSQLIDFDLITRHPYKIFEI